MLKKLGYTSYLFGIVGIIFVIYIINTENIQQLEPFLFLAGISISSIVQMMFVTYSLKTLKNRTYKKTGAIDEYLSLGLDDDLSVMQLPLIWRIIGWFILICSIGVGLISIAFFSEYAFSRWKKFDIFALYSFLSIIASIASVIYCLRVLNRKWIGISKKGDEL